MKLVYYHPLLLLCVLVSEVRVQDFVDEPPPDYLRRSSLDDCVERFHINTSYFHTSVHNGDPVEPGEFSAFAAIGWTRDSSQIDYLCGGTLISLSYVLTAAHCSADSGNKSPDTVRLGDVDLSRSDDDMNAQQIPIKRFTKHPSYKPPRTYYDIALIELERDIEPGQFVCTACLWTRMDLNFPSMTVLGFGATEFASSLSPNLLKASLAPLSASECGEQFLETRRLPEGIVGSQFCAGAPTKDACQGDSGGPILVELVDPTDRRLVPFVAGVISAGNGCNDGSLGLYSRVASYIDWIESITGVSFNHTQCARNTKCSVYYKEAKSRVVNQLYAPHFYAQLLRDANSESFFCGGALVDYRHVITSASCVSGADKPTHIEAFGNIVAVSEVTVHPNFNPQSLQNNLALLTLTQYINYEKKDSYTLPACLWKKPGIPHTGIFVSARELHGYRDNRFVINSTVVENRQCNPGYICTENEQNLIPETCQYDLGGPVSNYVRSIAEKYIPILYGVNAKGSACSGTGNTFEATQIYPHYDWIESVILSHVVNILSANDRWVQQEYYLNSTCLPPSGGIGDCVPDDACPQLIAIYRNDLSKIKICRFEGHRAIVCCPHSYL